MKDLLAAKADVWQGTLALMVLKTLEMLGPLHGYGIARRIEQTSAHHLSLNYGTLYPALLKLEQEGYVSSEWGVSENNRKAKFYVLTVAGRERPVTLAARACGGDQGLWLEGRETLRMTDFGIKPRTMMLGSLRVKDQIIVRYRMLLVPGNN